MIFQRFLLFGVSRPRSQKAAEKPPKMFASWPSWVHLGDKLRNLAPPWLQFGASWCQVGPNLAHLGVNLAPTQPGISLHLALWSHLGPGSRQKEARNSILKDFGPCSMHFCRILDHVSTDLGFDFLQVLKLKFVFFVSLRLDPPDFHFSKQRGRRQRRQPLNKH